MRKALLIIDIQNDYFEGGKFPLHNPILAAENTRIVLEKCRSRGIPVVHVQHINSQGALFFEPNTGGVEIHSSVKPEVGETTIIKHSPNSFKDTTLKIELDKLGVDSLIIVGMMTHMCIDTTIRAAKDLGYHCTLVADCCATRSLEYNGAFVDAKFVQTSYLGALNGYFADVVDSEKLTF